MYIARARAFTRRVFDTARLHSSTVSLVVLRLPFCLIIIIAIILYV